MTIAFSVMLGSLLIAGCDGGTKTSQQRPAPEVAVVTIQPQEVVLTTELPGRTAAFRVAEIRPQANGLIEKRMFTEGSDVTAGQTLYRIDAAPFQAVLDNAQAALNRSEANLNTIRLRAERVKELLVDKAVSQQDYDDAAAALKQTEADIQYWKAMMNSARINLGYCRVNAPISGRIGRSTVTEGAIVTAYQPMPLATIQQLDPMYVDVPQSTTDLLRLRNLLKSGKLDQNGPSQKKVGLLLADGTTYPWKGTLQFRDVTVEQTTGTVALRIVFPNPENILLPGMFVRAVVKEGVDKQAILVPQQAVSRDPKGNPLALVVDSQNKVEQRQLEIDRAIGNQWLVISGLAPGDRVIVEGTLKVRPGATVKAVSMEESAGTNPAAEKNSKQPTGPAK
ncbi:MAG: efflux RND transporter periplasmic adaptor subunit [Deltaproteobacteria bacterium]|nr:efflux RND transporter periplasmic adaptor subunit [Deltaproteobacteria bacterium]